MKELTVVSGKGGTGKTTVVAAFAALARSKVLADCDVDAADLHLVLQPRVKDVDLFQGGKTARIRQHHCTQCGKCRELCRFNAIQEDFVVDRFSCEGCGVCAEFCPERTIEMVEDTAGEWFISETRHGPMVHARLGIAQENSGKLVGLVRSEARKIAEERGLELGICDGSPGVGCPVIASIAGVDLVVAVTEPTLSGIHDFERVTALARHFKIPELVCVNKHDLNPEMTARIERFCDTNEIELAGKIPYDNVATKAQLAGKSVIEYSDGPLARGIESLWRGVVRILQLKQ